nr:hypothetical protein [Tanacetum cinerariifolium]
PADVGIIPGAAGGPKALGIQGLDLALFGEWLPRFERERSLIGASIGSWRFASACLPDPRAEQSALPPEHHDRQKPRAAGAGPSRQPGARARVGDRQQPDRARAAVTAFRTLDHARRPPCPSAFDADGFSL